MDDKFDVKNIWQTIPDKPHPIYNPFGWPPCADIPEVDVTPLKLGPLDVLPILLVLPDTKFYVERWKKSLLHFKEVGIDSVLEVPGTHGGRAGIKGTHSYDRDSPGEGYIIGAGYVSEWLNMYMLYNIMRVLPNKHFLKLECDSKFIPDWKYHFEQNIQYVPEDFDILWIGSCCLQDKLKKPMGGSVYKIDKYTMFPNCGQGYIISRKCINHVIQTQRDAYAPSDINLAVHTLPDLKCYAMFPHLVNQFDNNLPL